MTRELYFPNGETIPSTPAPTDILTAVKQVDGDGSGLDADTVNGYKPIEEGGGPRDQSGNHIKIGFDGTNVTATVNGSDVGNLFSVDPNNPVTGLGKPVLSNLTQAGHNGFSLLIDGELYSTSGGNGNYNNSTTGRGLTGQHIRRGLDNLQPVPKFWTGNIMQKGNNHHSYQYVLTDTNELWTWGDNVKGQCGLGHTNQVPHPTLVATDVVEVYDHPSNGSYHVSNNRLIVKKTDGNIYGCGYNGRGQLGLGNTTDVNTLTQLTGLGTNNIAKLFNLGSGWGCIVALTNDGRILVTGYNGHGQLGTNNTTNITSFTDVTNNWAGVTSGLLDIKVTGGFGYYNTAAVSTTSLIMLITLPDGSKIVRSCGANDSGQLGLGNTTAVNIPASPIGLPTNIADIVFVSTLTAQALTSTGDLYAWGHNAQGQVGDGTFTNKTSPVLVKSNVAQLLSDGWNAHTYGYRLPIFIKDINNKLWGVGENDDGELAVGDTVHKNIYQQPFLPNDENIKEIGMYTTVGGGAIVVVITETNTLYGWGYNNNGGVVDNAAYVSIMYPFQMPILKP